MVERTLISLPSQQQLSERLRHLIYLSSSLLFVSGGSGSGKSILAVNLSNALPCDLQQIHISLSSSTSVEKLRQQIITQLYRKPLFNSEDRLSETIAHLALQVDQDHAKNRLILIDNAQYLPESFILELCDLFPLINTIEGCYFNILLLGDDASNQRWVECIEDQFGHQAKRLFNQVELVLPILSAMEANLLLLHNFRQAGYQPKLQHQDALNAKLRACHGNPKKIIQLADGLSQGLIEPMGNVWGKARLLAILLMLVMVAIVSVLAIYLYPKFIPTSPVLENKIALSGLNGAAVVATIDNSIVNVIENGITNEITHEKGVPDPLAGSWYVQKAEITHNKNAVGLSDEKRQQVLLSGKQQVEFTALIGAEEPLEEEMPNIGVTPSLQIQQQSYDGISLALIAHNTEKEQAKNIKKMNYVILDEPPETKIPLDSTSTDILLSKPANHYTLQLAVMDSQASFDLFKKQYHLPQANVFVYKTAQPVKDRFIVVYGEFDTLQSAQLATDILPTPFKGMATQIKKWQVVHDDLRLNNE